MVTRTSMQVSSSRSPCAASKALQINKIRYAASWSRSQEKMTVTHAGRDSNSWPGQILLEHIMACNALTNWATESPSNSVAAFEYLSLHELAGIQPKRIPSWHVWWGGCGEVRHRLGQVPWVPILSITRITAGLCYQWLVHEIMFATRFTTRSKK